MKSRLHEKYSKETTPALMKHFGWKNIMAVPKLGRVKAARLLNSCRISQSKTVGGLSERQRAELVSLFNR